MDKTKHTNTRFVQGRLEACRLVNDKRFRRLEELPNDVYEVLMAKRKILMNIPTQLAYFVLQLAKRTPVRTSTTADDIRM